MMDDIPAMDGEAVDVDNSHTDSSFKSGHYLKSVTSYMAYGLAGGFFVS